MSLGFSSFVPTPNLNLASLHHKEFKVCLFSSHLAQRQQVREAKILKIGSYNKHSSSTVKRIKLALFHQLFLPTPWPPVWE
jgi:hypothetical protein